MVYPDLGSTNFDGKRRASLQDRFNAFCFDVLLLSPLISVVSLSVVYPLSFLTGVERALVTVVFGGILWIHLSAFCTSFWGGTPGKLLLKVSVVDVKSGRPPDLLTSLARSTLWLLEFFPLALPFLDVLKQEDRRALHDRLSGTQVVTLKLGEDSPVTPSEVQMARVVQRTVGSFLGLWVLMIAYMVVPQLDKIDRSPSSLIGGDESSRGSQSDCEVIQRSLKKNHGTLDQLLVLSQADLVSSYCLDEVAEKEFLKPEAQNQAWAALARSWIHRRDLKLRDEYIAEVCRLDSSAEGPCSLSGALFGNERAQGKSLLARVLGGGDAMIPYEDQSGVVNLLSAVNVLRNRVISGEQDVESSLQRLKEIYPRGDFSAEEERMCLAALTRSCTDQKISVCEEVAERFVQRTQAEESRDEEALAWLEYNKCRRVATGTLSVWRSIYEDKREIYNLARGLVGGEGGQMDLPALEQVLSDRSLSDLVRWRAFVHLVANARDNQPEQIMNIVEKIPPLQLSQFYREVLESSLRDDFQKLGLQLKAEDSADRAPASSIMPRWRKQ